MIARTENLLFFFFWSLCIHYFTFFLRFLIPLLLQLLLKFIKNRLKIGRYSDFQSVLYEFKKKLKKEWNEEAKKKSEVVDAEAPKKEEKEILRPSNHFILTPFDVERGRGLRALAREITDSLINQIRSKKPST